MSDEQRTPQFSDADLLAYLDGELEEGLAGEIENSPATRRRLAELARQERRLAAGLYRSSCPPSHELGEYHLQLLQAPDAAHVARHLEICPHCAMELAEMRATLRALAPELETSMVERLRVLVARLVPDLPSLGDGPAPMPALAGMRGEASGPLLYEADDVQVSLEVQSAGTGATADAAQRSVLGLVMDADAGGWQATLWQEEGPLAQMVQTLEVDELGNFMFEGLAPGSYALTLRGPDVEVIIQDLLVA